jgi:SseB protein N-terminal domain
VRTIPDPGFAGDDGAASSRVVAALAAYDAEPARKYAEVIGTLQTERLLVPVVTVLGEVEYDEQGLAHDKTSDMATVLMQGADGRLALLAFTSTDTMRRWNPDARPVPAPLQRVAAAARQDAASAVVVDVAGPVTFAIEGKDLRALADGFTLAELADGIAWVKEA